MVLSWAWNFIIVKVGLKQFAPLALASFRVVVAALLILPIYLLHGWAGHLNGFRQRFARRDFWKFAQLGLLGVVLNQGCFTVGLSYTTVGHASLIVGVGPIFVLLLACAQGLEALAAQKLIGTILALSGVAVLAVEKGLSLHAGTLRGDLVTMTGSLSFAFYAVLGKKVAARYDSLAMNTFNYLAGFILILPLAVWEGMRLNWKAVGWPGWAALAYMAAFGSVAAYLIFYWALRHMAASKLAAFSYFLPVLATLLGVLVLGEQVTTHLLVGGSLVLVGVYLAERGPRE